MPPTKRKFIRPVTKFGDKGTQPGLLYLVYKYEGSRLVSDGPYKDRDESINWMKELLAKGVCAWVVTYNA